MRRDWCDLSKDTSKSVRASRHGPRSPAGGLCRFVLDRIMSGAPREEVIESIHTFVRASLLDVCES